MTAPSRRSFRNRFTRVLGEGGVTCLVTVTYTQSNGDRVPATVISASIE